MPCPNCDHTLQNLGLDQAGRRSFWCPRCGTLKTEFDGTFTSDVGATTSREVRTEHETPSLVRRLREFERCAYGLNDTSQLTRDTWRRMGIAESIRLPIDRPA